MFIQELTAKMAASSGVVWIQEEDEVRLESKCMQVAANAGYNIMRWTFSDGLIPIAGKTYDERQRLDMMALVDPKSLLTRIKEWDNGPTLILAFDLFTMANRLPTLPVIARLIKDITTTQQTVEDPGLCQLVICDMSKLDLRAPLQRLTMEMPDRKEMEVILNAIIETLPKSVERDSRERLLNSLIGLPAFQASNAISEAVSRTGRLDANAIRAFKKEMVAAKGLTWIDPDPRGFNALGGLDPVKAWARKRVVAFNEEKRAAYGVRAPKGLVAGGKPGCAKSAFAKALASEWGVVLLRLDVGATRGAYVGDSEAAFNSALQTAAALAPAVILWIDEAEKAFGGVGGGSSDGGTSDRVFGSFLTWLQESQVFVYLAGNRMDQLPSEFTRAGRFDASMWFDLPTATERLSIANVFGAKYPQAGSVDVDAVVAASERCTGAEMEACYEEAALTAMLEDRIMTTEDVTAELARVSKVEDTFEMTDGLKKWRDSAIRANAEEAPAAAGASRVRRIRAK